MLKPVLLVSEHSGAGRKHKKHYYLPHPIVPGLSEPVLAGGSGGKFFLSFSLAVESIALYIRIAFLLRRLCFLFGVSAKLGPVERWNGKIDLDSTCL